ncbi:MAG: hypothetical protein R3C56_09780 [Pirellulaceae bacterium]
MSSAPAIASDFPEHSRFSAETATPWKKLFRATLLASCAQSELRLGDTLYQGEPIRYPGVPQFSPEVFAIVTCPDTSRRKQFDRGLQQLVEEGAIQLFHTKGRQKDAILAAVGELQFDVVQFRLENEYKAHREFSGCRTNMQDGIEPTRAMWRSSPLRSQTGR